MELTENLRELGGSLRSNAERLLRDVLKVHGQLVAHVDAVEAAPAAAPSRSSSSSSRERDRSPRDRDDRASRPARNGRPRGDDDELDVPEFIPGAR
jgi:hypothetical protein